jgi:hypothetical protein
MHIKTEIEGIYRDTKNNALLNKDSEALSAYKKMKKHYSDISVLKENVSILQNEMSEIKNLLTKIVEKI